MASEGLGAGGVASVCESQVQPASLVLHAGAGADLWSMLAGPSTDTSSGIVANESHSQTRPLRSRLSADLLQKLWERRVQ